MKGGREIIDFGKERRDRRNKQKRSSIEITPQGDTLYPENKIEVTEAEAITLAHGIIEKFRDDKALVEDFSARKRPPTDAYEPTTLTQGSLEERTQESLATQRKVAAASTTESLVRILQYHTTNPMHYYGTLLLAVAEELVKRFPETPTHS